MPARLDLTDKPFGTYTVVGPAPPGTDRLGRLAWECRCKCGEIVYAITSRLTSGKYPACPGCGNPRMRRQFERTCIACGKDFLGDSKAIVCSGECREARRRGVNAGVESLPPPTKDCIICGEKFHATRNLVCCSKACLRESRRRKALADWRRRIARDPDLSARMNARRREKAKADPEYAAKLREWDARKWEKHRQRMEADPEYAGRYRELARRHYTRHAAEIQARRKARVEAMSDADLAELMERMRHYGREHRKRRRADPARREADRIAYREWKRRQKLGLLQIEAGILLREARERTEASKGHPARRCAICGDPILGRHPTAKTCSDDCQRLRRLSLLYPPRTVRCVVCGDEFETKTAARTCSSECQKVRKAETNAQSKQRNQE